MKRIGRLRHLAAGLLDSFVGRNNDVEGYWAPGMLYAQLPGCVVRLDLLRWDAEPATDVTVTVARNYGEQLRRALPKIGLAADELIEATIEVTFETAPAVPAVRYFTTGEPFDCVITLRNRYGQQVMRHAHGRCHRLEPNLFSRRGSW
ncbi:hypothetical protein ACFFTM_10250 [Pseudoduganella plicata]|uniref:Uncharacterized protein n=1 Tax=Pseudoduganella plicata TaxID=321984 RepID=A0A4P7BF62_9BURK|nr:hypothetical protein [Pseudoduganella plicata]QBQ36165.1 hypothetical protein E1742_08350 [Pseudoduganella plicata]GGY77581.1 hypothetical protein GCM10007388_07980 [Pseudoduganella plicata]